MPIARLTQNIPEAQLDAATRTKLNSPGGLDQAAVDARIQAVKANTAPIANGWVRNGLYAEGNGVIGDATRWAAANHRHPFTEHEAEVQNSFTGNAWEPTTKVEFSVVASTTRVNLTTNRPAANTARNLAYSSTVSDISPARVNHWVTFRVREADVGADNIRVNFDTGGTAFSNPASVKLNDPPSNNFREVDRWTTGGVTWVAFSVLMQNVPVGARFGGQEFDKFELDLSRVDPSNIIEEFHATERLGTTTLGDGPGVGTFFSSLNGVHRSTFTLFSPTFDLDTAANQHGLVIGRVTLTLSGRSSTSTGFTDGHDTVHRFGGFVSYRDVVAASALFNASAARTSGGLAGGVALDSVDYYDATTPAGDVTVYIARNANNELGYYYEYAPRTGYTGTGHTNVASDLDLFYEHSGVGASGGGSLVTQPLGSTVKVHFTENGLSTGTLLASYTWSTTGVDIMSYTATSSGLAHINFITHMQADAPTGGGGRVYADQRIIRTRASVDTIIARDTEYIRNVTTIDNERYRTISVWHQVQAGDVIKLQAFVALQNSQAAQATAANGVTWGAANNEIEIYMSP